MKKNILISAFCILLFSCSTEDESPIQEPETTAKNPTENGSEQESGNEGTENELSINETFELTGLPLQIFELNIPDLPGTENDYQINIQSDSTVIYNLTMEKFEIVIPLNTALGVKSLSLKYKGQQYDLGTINIVEIVDVIPTNIGFYETDIPSKPLVILDSLNNKIVPFMKDGKVQGISIESPNDKNAYIKLNEYYLPTHIQTDSINIIFDNYNIEDTTVDIAYYINNDFENAQIVNGVNIPEEILSLSNSIQTRSVTKTSSEISDVLNAVGVGISGALCIVSGVTALTGVLTWLGTIGAVTTCGSFLHSLLATIDPQLENQLATYLSSVLAIKLNTIGCLMILNKPSPLELFNKWSACTEIILQGSTHIRKLFEENEGQIIEITESENEDNEILGNWKLCFDTLIAASGCTSNDPGTCWDYGTVKFLENNILSFPINYGTPSEEVIESIYEIDGNKLSYVKKTIYEGTLSSVNPETGEIIKYTQHRELTFEGEILSEELIKGIYKLYQYATYTSYHDDSSCTVKYNASLNR